MERTAELVFSERVPVTIRSHVGSGLASGTAGRALGMGHGMGMGLGVSAGSPLLPSASANGANARLAAGLPAAPSAAGSHPVGGLTGARLGPAASPGTSPGADAESGGSPVAHYQEKRHPGITVQVVQSSRNSGRYKVLEIQLTDESDPYFLYNLEIAEDDFHALKAQQNLLVDFAQFPHNVIDLLRDCIKSSLDEHPKHVAHLVCDSGSRYATFSIVETNSFKHINHLSLQFTPGNDAAVKQYLAALVKDFKAENASLRDQLSSTGSSMTAKLCDAESTISRLSAELDQTKMSLSSMANNLKLAHSAELAQERERSATERESIRMESERLLRETERKHEEEARSLTEKVAKATSAHANVKQHAEFLDGSLKAALQQNEALSKDLAALQSDHERLTAAHQTSERSRTELETALAAARERIRDTERHGRDAEDSARRLDDRMALLQEQKAKAEETIEVYKAQTTRLEDSLGKATEEITKGNEIIRKLQTELKNLKSKLKLKNVVTLQQEKLLDERATTIETLQKEISGLKDTVGKKNDEIDGLRQRSEELKRKLDEGKAIIEDNNNIIEYLHKQLNDEALSRPLPSTLAGGGLGSMAAGLGGIDFDKYASMAAGATDASRRRSPTGATTAYRSRYVPPEVTSGQGLQSSLNGPDHHASAPYSAYNPNVRNTTSPLPTRPVSGYTGSGIPRLGNQNQSAADRGHAPAMMGGPSPSLHNPMTSTSNIATPTTHFHSGTGTNLGGRHGATKTGGPSTQQPGVKSSYF